MQICCPCQGMELWGKNLKINSKKGKRKLKNFKDLVPEISGKRDFSSFKRKSSFTPNAGDQKHMRYDNNKNNRNYGQNKTGILLRCITATTTSPLALMDRDLVASRRKG